MCKKGMCGGKCMGMCFCGNKNLGLLLLRLTTGFIFLANGVMKLQNMDMVIGYFSSMGIPVFLTWIVALAEVIFGAMVILGIFTRKAATVLGIIIVFAFILVHSKGDFGGMELAIALFGATFALASIGGGRYSVMGMCKCGGKCMGCKDEHGCAGGVCSTSMKCDGCGKCANGVCSMHEGKEMKCVIEMNSSCSEENRIGKCDMSKCATMTKDECAKMCDSLKCTPEQKEMCLSHYDANGKYIAKEEKACCAKKGEAKKQVNVQMSNDNGKAKATVTISENGKETVQVFEGTEAEVKAKVEAIK